jgi:ribosomal protein S12 methylthiotransferase
MHVDDEIKEERWNRFMKVQQQISTEKLAEKVGSTIEIIIDEANEEVIIGRSAADAPEIDGLVYVETKEEIELGEIISAKVVKSDEYDLFASF